MIDKNIDAGTRRMLVRRDVEKFEQDCGGIDPDATAAFKALLAADKPVAPVARRVDMPAMEQVRKADRHPLAAAGLPAAAAPAAANERGRNEVAVTDVQWLDAVRHALVPHDAEPSADAVAKTPDAVLHAQWPGQQEAALPPRAAPAPAAPIAAPVAPALPPAATAAAPVVPPANPDHPVPPAAIPDPADMAVAGPGEHHSRIGRWIARVPLLGSMWENGRR